jgi:hypothetical protein
MANARITETDHGITGKFITRALPNNTEMCYPALSNKNNKLKL